MTEPPPRRGEVWLVAFGASRPGEPGKNRPAIVVSADHLHTGSTADLFMVVPLSSHLPASALRPEIKPIEGVDRSSRAICRAIRGVAPSRLLRKLGAVTPETLIEVERTLALVLGLGAPGRGSRTSPA